MWLVKVIVYRRLLIALLLGLAFTGCGSSQYAPVQELSYSSSASGASSGLSKTPTSYQVKSGDTMFAIAWRYGWDYKKLAQANHISSPYTIYVGQKLYFSAQSSALSKKSKNNSKIIQKPKVAKVSAAPKAILASSSSANSKPKLLNNNYNNSKLPVKWQWPISGSLVQKFSNSGKVSHGIELSSKLGNSVKAAASGIVVYAGSGIQGYGNLVVVKHNDTFLSAYAYNSRIMVAEGAQVSVGQVIAEVGKGPQLDPRLHFEIRKDGKPVNPLWYLPKS